MTITALLGSVSTSSESLNLRVVLQDPQNSELQLKDQTLSYLGLSTFKINDVILKRFHLEVLSSS